ncbi:MAG TPA: tagatose 1,6-diphosphate aldolase, partial [Anaerolineaceae bacterium]
LLDPVLGAGPALAADALPGTTGLVVSVEETGYAGPASARVSRLPEGWDCGKIKRMGASAAKLLVYYHPASSTAAGMRELIQRVAEDCRRLDLPLFLELLAYSPDPEQKELSAGGRREAVIRSAEELSALGADILKMEFPVDVRREPDENAWGEACRELTATSRIPWVLLSAAVDFEVFQRQTEIACQAGASGVLAGRAIWKESVEAGPEQRMDFLCGTGIERLRLLGETCRKYARPYPGLFAPAAAPEDWQASYAGL